MMGYKNPTYIELKKKYESLMSKYSDKDKKKGKGRKKPKGVIKNTPIDVGQSFE